MTERDTKTVAASPEELRELHGKVARAFLSLIDRYERGEILDRDGNPKPAPASLLAQATKFLAVNGVDRPEHPAVTDDPLDAELPDLPELRAVSGEDF